MEALEDQNGGLKSDPLPYWYPAKFVKVAQQLS